MEAWRVAEITLNCRHSFHAYIYITSSALSGLLPVPSVLGVVTIVQSIEILLEISRWLRSEMLVAASDEAGASLLVSETLERQVPRIRLMLLFIHVADKAVDSLVLPRLCGSF